MKKKVKNLIIGGAFLGLGMYALSFLKIDKNYEPKEATKYKGGPRRYIDLTKIHNETKKLERELKELDEELEDAKEEIKVLKKEAV